MKRLSLAASVLLLSGCELTSNNAQPESELAENQTQNQLENAAHVSDIYDALTIDTLERDLQANEEPVPVFDDVWERIRYQLSIPVPQNRPVVTERNYYARHQAYLDRISKRGAPYLYYIVEEVEKRQMPIELALLPIVESAFDPFGMSIKSASGIWQFMPATGERFGLTQNWWVDNRRNITESTRAALDYLTYLHKTLDNDWLNAIAAYNSGEGRVMRAIKKNRKRHLPTDFWSLDLPRETTAYVPKLLALADLLKRSDEFNISWKPIVNAEVVQLVDVGSQIDLTLAAEMADISITELYRLNPAFNRWATDPAGPHQLLLPSDKVTNFKTALAKTSLAERIRWDRYTVKKGDSLSVIASKYNTSSSAIRTLNKKSNNMIRIGEQLLVPMNTASLDQDVVSGLAPHLAGKKTAGKKQQYKVKRGDTLWDISREFDVTIRQLAKWNKLSANAVIKPGQSLTIWKAERSQTKQVVDKQRKRVITYKVRRGDSLARIASQFNVRIKDIEKWNGISKRKYLQPGQRLKLHINVNRG